METAAEQEDVVIEQIVAAAGIVVDSVAVQDLRNMSLWKPDRKAFDLNHTLKVLLGVFQGNW